MNKIVKIIIFVVIVLALAITGFFLYPDKTTDAPNGGENPIGEDIDTSDWQTYTNEEYGFEVKYPDSWIVKEQEGLITFQDRAKKVYYEGGEIYLVSVAIGSFDSNEKMKSNISNWEKNTLKRGGWVNDIKIIDRILIQGSDYLGLYTIDFINDRSYFIITKVNLPDYPTLDETYNLFLDSFKKINK